MRAVPAVLALLLGLAAPVAQAAPPVPPGGAQQAGPAPDPTMTAVVVGAGAVAGVLAFNLLALGWQAVPLGASLVAEDSVAAEMSVAISRVYAASSAVIGGFAGDYFSHR